MALTGPDGEQHSHIQRRADRATPRSVKAQKPELPPMRPDRGRWVFGTDTRPAETANARGAAGQGLVEIIERYPLNDEQRRTLVQALGIVASLRD